MYINKVCLLNFLKNFKSQTNQGFLEHGDYFFVLFWHFGREEPEFTWERTDKVQALKEAFSL